MASAAISSAWRSRWMTCDDTGAGSSPSRGADARLDRRIEMRERADGAGDLSDLGPSRGRAEARIDVAQDLRVPERELQAERHRLGMDAVRPADHRCSAMLVGPRANRHGEPVDQPRRIDVAGLAPSEARARCRERRTRSGRSAATGTMGRRSSATAVVNAMTSWLRASSRSRRCAERGRRCRARGALADLPGGLRRHDSGLRHRVRGGNLDREPGLVATAHRSRWRPFRGSCSAESSPRASRSGSAVCPFCGPSTVAPSAPFENRSSRDPLDIRRTSPVRRPPASRRDRNADRSRFPAAPDATCGSTVFSSDSIRLPFRWSFERRSSVFRAPASASDCRSSSTTRSITSPTASLRAAGIDRQRSRVAIRAEPAEHRVGQAALLPDILEEPRAHRAAEQRVQDVAHVPVVVLLRVAGRPHADVALLQFLCANDERRHDARGLIHDGNRPGEECRGTRR